MLSVCKSSYIFLCSFFNSLISFVFLAFYSWIDLFLTSACLAYSSNCAISSYAESGIVYWVNSLILVEINIDYPIDISPTLLFNKLLSFRENEVLILVVIEAWIVNDIINLGRCTI